MRPMSQTPWDCTEQAGRGAPASGYAAKRPPKCIGTVCANIGWLERNGRLETFPEGVSLVTLLGDPHLEEDMGLNLKPKWNEVQTGVSFLLGSNHVG